MQTGNGVGHRNGDSQERSDREAGADHPLERPGLRGLEHQPRLTSFPHQLNWTKCPLGLEVILQLVLMHQTGNRGLRRVFGSGMRRQKLATAVVVHIAPDPAVETLAVLPQEVKRLVFRSTPRRLRRRSH